MTGRTWLVLLGSQTLALPVPLVLSAPAGVNQLLRVSATHKTANYINTVIIWNVFYIHLMCVFGSVGGLVLKLNKAHAEWS